jgi:hypothetical protein
MATFTTGFSDTYGVSSFYSLGSACNDSTTYAYSTLTTGGYSYGSWKNPKTSPVVAGATINSIKISLRGYVATGSSTYSGTGCRWRVKLISVSSSWVNSFSMGSLDISVAKTQSLDKTPAAWGITQAQALDLCMDLGASSSHVTVIADNQSGTTETLRLEYISMEVDYTNPPVYGQYIIGNNFG